MSVCCALTQQAHCQGQPFGGPIRHRRVSAHCNKRNQTAASAAAKPQAWPQGYTQAIRQAQNACQAALNDGKLLLEVEFPTASLASVAGDAEGANEMTYSCQYLRQFVRAWQSKAASTRIFFPDQREMQVAASGARDPEFEQSSFPLDYLTKPTPLLDLGIDLNKVDVAKRAKDSDEMFIIAYPHFNVNEMIAVEDLWSGAAKDSRRPIIVFNGELDRIRSAYYPPFFYPKIGKLAREFIPQFEQAFYIHNFKPNGVLFRVYPGPWQVLKRHPVYYDQTRVVHTQDEMPTLKKVALEILPNT